MSEFAQVSRRLAGAEETAAANRSWWDAEAEDYYAEHGAFLGDEDFVWGPEGWRESELGLLGEVAGRRVLEVGAGAASARAGWRPGGRSPWPRISPAACSEQPSASTRG